MQKYTSSKNDDLITCKEPELIFINSICGTKMPLPGT